MTNNESPPNSNDDGFQQLSFFAAPATSEGEAEPVKAVASAAAEPELATLELAPTEPTPKKTRGKSKVVKHNSNDSRRTVIMNVTEPELKIDFEASLAELETVVKELDGEVKLEKALQLFEQGIKLSVECEQFIKGAEAKIEILKKQADGSLATEVFQGERVDLDD
ncbi:hypothetical protein BH11CYA1_BH11CYA1_48330 [soil metagenome]